LDGLNWVTWGTWITVGQGTSTASSITNLAIGAIPKLRIGTIINANTVAVSTLRFWRTTPKRLR